MSFYTSLTGLNSATAQLAVTANNIANVGTSGFKRSRADFGDIFSTSPLQKASAAIGQGVLLKQVSQEFSQGNISTSGNSLDLAITGDGFFPLRSPDGLQEIYTRNGSFTLNDQNNVVNSTGQRLLAASVDSSGKADLTNLSPLTIPPKTSGQAQETKKIQLGLNLPASSSVIEGDFDRTNPATYNKSTALTVYDSGGNGYLATVYYKKTQNASQSSPFSKWQTYFYVGNTLVKPGLQQNTDAAGSPLYVNKYGDVRPKSDSSVVPSSGKTEMYTYDGLTDTRASTAAKGIGAKIAASYFLNGQFQNIPAGDVVTFGLKVDGATVAQDIVYRMVAEDKDPEVLAGHLEVAINNQLGPLAKGTARYGLTVGFDADTAQFTISSGTTGDNSSMQIVPAASRDIGKLTLSNTSSSFVAGNLASVKLDGTTYSFTVASGATSAQDVARGLADAINSGTAGYSAYAENGGIYLKAKSDGAPLPLATTTFTLAQGSGASTGSGTATASMVISTHNTSRIALAGTYAIGETSTVTLASGVTFTSAAAASTRSASLVAADLAAQINASPAGYTAYVDGGNLYINGKTDGTALAASTVTNTPSGTTSTVTATTTNNLYTPVATSANTANYLGFTSGLSTLTETVSPTDAVRGKESLPAKMVGDVITINTSRAVSITSSNKDFFVSVDGIAKTISLDYPQSLTMDKLTTQIQNKINAMVDADTGRKISGVTVAFNPGTKRLEFTTGTTGDTASIQVTGSGDWGLANTAMTFGRTTSWIKLTQHTENGALQYVKNGVQTEDGTGASTKTEWWPVYLDRGELSFDLTGKTVSPLQSMPFETAFLDGGKGALTMSIDFTQTTQYSSAFAVLSQSQDGAPEGDLMGLNIGVDGLVNATYSNGSQVSLGKIVLTNFSSPSGLRQAGDASYLASATSGAPKLGEAGSAGFGSLRAGATERANVDLTQELVDLINAQRNFQANAKAIETNSTMTQAVINLRS